MNHRMFWYRFARMPACLFRQDSSSRWMSCCWRIRFDRPDPPGRAIVIDDRIDDPMDAIDKAPQFHCLPCMDSLKDALKHFGVEPNRNI